MLKVKSHMMGRIMLYPGNTRYNSKQIEHIYCTVKVQPKSFKFIFFVEITYTVLYCTYTVVRPWPTVFLSHAIDTGFPLLRNPHVRRRGEVYLLLEIEEMQVMITILSRLPAMRHSAES
jgi:hypothetical protein